MGNPDIKTFKKNETICKKGDFSDCMYDITYGSVGIYDDSADGMHLLATLYPGDTFGEIGLIDSCARSATAIALENNTTIRIITTETFSEYMKDKPAKVIKIMQHLGDRLRRLTDDYMEAKETLEKYLELEEKKEQKPQSLLNKIKSIIKRS
ncbi:MAG: cyclic nucleotide-binding domain-containing protein [Sphaerochaetaceae bacterium]|nr:cyclic nucleotide-binding domain-containing protein [Sphaerochaetaceae bacterium]